jgi:UDP-N-acetyl-D-glucosamine dehydrogenase
MNQAAQELLRKIESHDALVGIIGLGYVGLPLALCFAEKEFNVLGFDIDPEKIEKLKTGVSYIKHLDQDRINSAVEAGLFDATTDFNRLAQCDAILICVPTPLGAHKEPDLSYVENSTKDIRKTLQNGQLIVLESTTYPGTTDELLKDILESPLNEEETTQKCGSDFFLAFSPEREDPGNPEFGTKNIPKVVGGVDEMSGDLAEALYAQVLDSTVRVKNARTAESTKLMENIFRAVNIALVNELKMIFDKMNVDIWDVLDAAETKPFGFMRFNPGPGLGGHCIPLDPFYLAWKARECGQPTRFIELAGEINTQMPHYVIEKLTEALNEQGKALKGSKILILGLAYKPDIDDPRESPAFEIIDLLIKRGAEVSYHDPHIPVAPRMRSWPSVPRMRSVDLTEDALWSCDAVLLITNHDNVDYELVISHVPLLIDTRGGLHGRGETVCQA